MNMPEGLKFSVENAAKMEPMVPPIPNIIQLRLYRSCEPSFLSNRAASTINALTTTSETAPAKFPAARMAVAVYSDSKV